jgi:nicotinamidase-related amidase
MLVRLARLTNAFRKRELPIYHSVRLYRPDGTNVDLCRREMVEEGTRVLMPGSIGSELVDEIRPLDAPRLDPVSLIEGKAQEIGRNEKVLFRPRWGAFHQTRLEQSLKEAEVNTLVVCGLNFVTGTRASLFEASARDFRLVLVCDATCGATEEALKELGRIGVHLMPTDACIKWLQKDGRRAA